METKKSSYSYLLFYCGKNTIFIFLKEKHLITWDIQRLDEIWAKS